MRILIFFLSLLSIIPTYSQQPNIIIIMTDDGRYDTDNATYFPNIARIAEEGITYTNAFAVNPLCSPSRSVIQSGLYPHKTNNMYNYTDIGSAVDTSDFILASELKESGYYTAFVGKAFNDWKKPLRGYNYWAGSTAGNTYDNPNFNINGINQTVNGYFTEITFDFALTALGNKPSDKPIFLMVCDKAPHSPLINTSAFNDEVFNTPDNFTKYSSNYPSFLYPQMEYTESLTKLEKKIEKFHETLACTDTGIGRILTWLEQNGELDNTLILYTSDHGFMLGEHKLNGKGLCYDESLRIPLFIRYPEWFAASTSDDKLILNTDIVPTVFEAAGISYSGELDGESALSVNRNKLMFEFQVNAIPGLPSFRGIRTNQYKYVEHYCTDTIFEMFDLENDPQENTNVAYEPQYLAIRAHLKNSLDSIRESMNDNDLGETLPCFLVNPLKKKPEYGNEIYDFYGREINEENPKGLYIQNGRLVWFDF